MNSQGAAPAWNLPAKSERKIGGGVRKLERRKVGLLKKLFRNSQQANNTISEGGSDFVLDEYSHHKRAIRFVIYMANGGRVIECSRVSPSSGERTYSMHVVSNEAPLGDAIEKIITIEGLR
jgi:hypothetical protein